MTLASIIAAWAVLWVLVAAVVMAAGLRRGRPLPAAAWLVTIGAFLAAQEDPLLLIQMASTRPSTTGFRDGVLGLVHAHTRGHMYGAANLALAGLGLAVVVAHAALRRARPGPGGRWPLSGCWEPSPTSSRCSGSTRTASRWPRPRPMASAALAGPR